MLDFHLKEINRKMLNKCQIIPLPTEENIYFFAINKTEKGSKFDFLKILRSIILIG